MPTFTSNVSFQLFADNEEPWEHRTDFTKLDDIFSGVETVPAIDVDDLTVNTAATVNRIEGNNGAAVEVVKDNNVADDAKVALGPVDDFDGMVDIFFVYNSNVFAATVEVDGPNDSVTIIDNTSSFFTTTEGNDGTGNVYWDAGNSRFEVENRGGAAGDIVRIVMRNNE